MLAIVHFVHTLRSWDAHDCFRVAGGRYERRCHSSEKFPRERVGSFSPRPPPSLCTLPAVLQHQPTPSDSPVIPRASVHRPAAGQQSSPDSHPLRPFLTASHPAHDLSRPGGYPPHAYNCTPLATTPPATSQRLSSNNHPQFYSRPSRLACPQRTARVEADGGRRDAYNR